MYFTLNINNFFKMSLINLESKLFITATRQPIYCSARLLFYHKNRIKASSSNLSVTKYYLQSKQNQTLHRNLEVMYV